MNDESREVSLHQPPPEVIAYLDKLVKLCGYKDQFGVGVIAAVDMPARAGVTDNPDGFLRLSPDNPPLIVISEATLGSSRWQSILAHEFLHLLRWSIDEYVLQRLEAHEHETYMRLVESTMKPLSILLMVGGLMNVEWVDEEKIS